MENYKLVNERTEWFAEARLGMFIHFGLFSVAGRGEWVKSVERISDEEYNKYFEEFNPVNYNPREWARIAKEAGMKYVVMTAKHHDGFCLFDSKLTDYKSTNTQIKRDLIREYVEAARAEGLRVGIYYSLLDWHHEDYPMYEDLHHPMRGREEIKEKQQDFKVYVKYMHDQVRELLSNYGKIDLLWFDFSYSNMTGDKWEADKLMKMIRQLQPDILVNNRLGGNIKSKNPESYTGDFTTPEQHIPKKSIVNEDGFSIPWEACITHNNSWGYGHYDRSFKTEKEIIRALVQCVSKNGNLLFNVGPDAYGNIPEQSIVTLRRIGQWLRRNGDSIYGCGMSNLEKPEWGYFTQNENNIYAHVFEKGIGPIAVDIKKELIKVATTVADGAEVRIVEPWPTADCREGVFIEEYVHHPLPDDVDTVIKFNLKAKL